MAEVLLKYPHGKAAFSIPFQFRVRFQFGHNIHKQIFIFQWPGLFRAEWSRVVFPGGVFFFLGNFLNAAYGEGRLVCPLYGFSAFVSGQFSSMNCVVFAWIVSWNIFRNVFIGGF